MEQEYVNNQIAKYQTGKGLLEALDTLDFNHKIRFNALDYSKGTGENTVSSSANIDYDLIGLIADKIINGVEFGTLNENKSRILLYENKILSHKKDENGKSPVTILIITKNSPAIKLRYKVSIENGVGTAQKTATGGIQCAKGSYVKTKSVQIFLSEFDFERFLWKILQRVKEHRAIIK